jgi:hypothetical protein
MSPAVSALVSAANRSSLNPGDLEDGGRLD